MMTITAPDRRSDETVIASLTDDPGTNAMALGCAPCHLRPTCGGLCVASSIIDCLDLCCGRPSNCTRVCRNRPAAYVEQLREIDGFELHNIERAPVRPVQLVSKIFPLVYHGGSRAKVLAHDAFALRLPDLINFKLGTLRFASRAELCAAYRIKLEAQIILTGVNLDHKIEPWWSLSERRIPLIRGLANIGIALVTSPNFSVVLDQPRTDDMHAIKRIGIVFAEFLNNGLPCALHPNGRTDRDFERWAEFIAVRPEVSVLAYEFITGPGRKSRTPFHLSRLADLARAAGRELDIVVRGHPGVIPNLRQHYRNVIYIETTAFMKSVKRQKAVRYGNRDLQFAPHSTESAAQVDALFTHNLSERISLIGDQYYGENFHSSEAA